MPAVTAARLSVVDVSPGISVNVVPPSVLTCHWYEVAEAVAVNVAASPSQTVTSTGCVLMLATLLTVSTAVDEVAPAGVQVLVITTLYWLLFMLVVTAGTVSVAEVAPA